jgi:hypothetical protein
VVTSHYWPPKARNFRRSIRSAAENAGSGYLRSNRAAEQQPRASAKLPDDDAGCTDGRQRFVQYPQAIPAGADGPDGDRGLVLLIACANVANVVSASAVLYSGGNTVFLDLSIDSRMLGFTRPRTAIVPATVQGSVAVMPNICEATKRFDRNAHGTPHQPCTRKVSTSRITIHSTDDGCAPSAMRSPISFVRIRYNERHLTVETECRRGPVRRQRQ